MMWTSEEILQATIDVFMDEYGPPSLTLGRPARTLTYPYPLPWSPTKPGPTRPCRSRVLGSPGGSSKPLQTRPETSHPSPRNGHSNSSKWCPTGSNLVHEGPKNGVL